MRKFIATCAALACVGVTSTATAAPPEIEIKGIHLGMTYDELKELGADVDDNGRDMTVRDFTVAEMPGYYLHGGATLKMTDDKLTSLIFLFHRNAFDDIRNAVKAKYPKTRCVSTRLQNGFGVRITNTDCVYESGMSRLLIQNSLEDGDDTGSLMLSVRKPQPSEAEKQRKRRADL